MYWKFVSISAIFIQSSIIEITPKKLLNGEKFSEMFEGEILDYSDFIYLSQECAGLACISCTITPVPTGYPNNFPHCS